MRKRLHPEKPVNREHPQLPKDEDKDRCLNYEEITELMEQDSYRRNKRRIRQYRWAKLLSMVFDRNL